MVVPNRQPTVHLAVQLQILPGRAHLSWGWVPPREGAARSLAFWELPAADLLTVQLFWAGDSPLCSHWARLDHGLRSWGSPTWFSPCPHWPQRKAALACVCRIQVTERLEGQSGLGFDFWVGFGLVFCWFGGFWFVFWVFCFLFSHFGIEELCTVPLSLLCRKGINKHQSCSLFAPAGHFLTGETSSVFFSSYFALWKLLSGKWVFSSG